MEVRSTVIAFFLFTLGAIRDDLFLLFQSVLFILIIVMLLGLSLCPVTAGRRQLLRLVGS